MTPAGALLSLALNTAQVNDLAWKDGLLWAATAGGVEVYAPDGERIAYVTSELPQVEVEAVGFAGGDPVVGTAQGAARWDGAAFARFGPASPVVAVVGESALSASGVLAGPGGERSLQSTGVTEVFTDAVEWDGRLVAGTLSGGLLIEGGAAGREGWRTLPGPILDLAVVDGRLRVALGLAAAEIDASGEVRLIDVPATAAGPAWGTASGEVRGEDGVIARFPGAITSIVAAGDALAVGTEAGLYWLDGGARRLTGAGQICGRFVTGITRWRGQLTVATFDAGACVLTDEGWERIPGLPSPMLNAALADGDSLYLASDVGLIRVSPDGTVEVTGVAPDPAPAGTPGLHTRSVTGLARGDRLWITDQAGPLAVDAQQRWARYRYHVWGTSHQRVAACGPEAWTASEDAGVHWFDGRRWRSFDALTGLPDDWVMAVACAGRGVGFAGTYQDGVWRYEAGSWEEIPGLPDPWVLSLAAEGGTLWAGTMGGLYRYAGGRWEGAGWLPDARVHALLVEETTVWVGTENGLAALAR